MHGGGDMLRYRNGDVTPWGGAGWSETDDCATVYSYLCDLQQPLNLSEAQVPLLHAGDNTKQVVLFWMKGRMYVHHLAQCQGHRNCSIDSKERLGQAGIKPGAGAVRGKLLGQQS